MIFSSLRIKPLFALLLCFPALLTVVFILFMPDTARTSGQASDPIAFLSGLGWQADASSEQIGTVSVPDRFNAVFSAYNDLQLSQGFDLTPYAGCELEKRSYRLLNYPGGENATDVYANLLFFNGKIVGGDICSVRLDGFLRGLK